MFKKKRETDTLTQQRTRQYVKMMLGAYLIYTAYSMGRDLHQGIQADNCDCGCICIIWFIFMRNGLCKSHEAQRRRIKRKRKSV